MAVLGREGYENNFFIQTHYTVWLYNLIGKQNSL